MGAYLLMHPRRTVTVILFRVITQVPGFVAVGIWFLMQVGLGFFGGSSGGRRLRRSHRRLHRGCGTD